MSLPLVITDKITLPGSDLEWSAVRASGPGGQNVNKVSTKVELTFDFESTVALTEPQRKRLRDLAKKRRVDTKKKVGAKKKSRARVSSKD